VSYKPSPRLLVIRPQFTENYYDWAFSVAIKSTRLPSAPRYRDRIFSCSVKRIRLSRAHVFAFPACTRLVASASRTVRIERSRSPSSVFGSHSASSYQDLRSRDWAFSIHVGCSRLSLSQRYSEESIPVQTAIILSRGRPAARYITPTVRANHDDRESRRRAHLLREIAPITHYIISNVVNKEIFSNAIHNAWHTVNIHCKRLYAISATTLCT